MAKKTREQFIGQLGTMFGELRPLPSSHSMFEIMNGAVHIYIRYSKRHHGERTFYGLRQRDLQALRGHPAFIVFLWEDQEAPLLLPYGDYEDVFAAVPPAPDGQYKTQIYIRPGDTEMYLPGAGRFNVESHFGWDELDRVVRLSGTKQPPVLSHAQVQTLLGSIGAARGFDIWIPQNDRAALDWEVVTSPFQCRQTLPSSYGLVADILGQVDVLWLARGSGELAALYEIEHSTPIYSGLLRLNDIHVGLAHSSSRFTVVAKECRRALFIRQLHRPTFEASGLHDICGFLQYANVYNWYARLRKSMKGSLL